MYYSSEQSVQPCSVTSVESGNIQCLEPGCDFRIHRLKQFQHHLTSVHGFAVNTFTLYFENIHKFYLWKDEYEKKHGFTFVMLTTKDKSSHVYFYCSLGRKARIVNGMRRLTNQCPTRLVLNCNRFTGQVYVDLIDGHYGHALPDPNSSASLQLSKAEVQFLKEVMRQNNFNKALIQKHFNQMEISNAKKDLFMKEFEKKRFHEVYRYAEESFTAESPVTDWQRLMPEGEDSAVIIHKRKGEIISDLRHQNCHHRLNMEDFPVNSFMIGVMTDRQKEILLRYGSTIVLELVLPQETTSNQSSIKQLYVLVMDHLGREFQVGFFVLDSMDFDTRGFRSFFLAVKAKCGNLRPKLLIVNERTCLFTYWLEVFNGHVPHQLVSPWFIEAEFNSVLIDNMIANSLMQKLEELFSSTVREFKVQAFEEKLTTLIKTLNSQPGAQEVLNYVSETLLPCLSNDSTSALLPKWAHHAFPSFKDEITLSTMTFTTEKLKGLHGFNNHKLGRCVYLMMQRQLQRRQLRHVEKSSGSPTAHSNSDATGNDCNSSPTFDAFRHENKQRQKNDLKERCQKLIRQMKNIESSENLCKVGEEILKVTKLFTKSDRGKCPAYSIKVAEDLCHNLNLEHQRLSVSSSASSLCSKQTPPLLTGTSKKNKLDFDANLLTVKRNSNQGPIVLSSYSPTSRPNKRRKISSLSNSPSATDVHAYNRWKSTTVAGKNSTLHPALNSVTCTVRSSDAHVQRRPNTGNVSRFCASSKDHDANKTDRSFIGKNTRSTAFREIINSKVDLSFLKASVAPSQSIDNTTRITKVPTAHHALSRLHTSQLSSNVQVPSLSTNKFDGGFTSAVPLEKNSSTCIPSHVTWQIDSEDDDAVFTKIKEEKETRDEDFSSHKILEITAEDVQDWGSPAAWS